jgi:glycosyltransferase involved in cell wall biosynthesis
MIVLHIDSGRELSPRHDQLRLLMRELDDAGVEQICVCPPGSPLLRLLAMHGLRTEPTPWKGRLAWTVRRSLSRFARTADVIHCHDEGALEIAASTARWRRRPLVVTRSDAHPVRPEGWNRVTAAIAVSEAVRQATVSERMPADRVRVIRPAIDLDAVRLLAPASPSFRERLAIEADRFVAGTIGVMLEQENQKLLARAAASERRVIWVIVGDGPERASIQAAIAAHGVMANVRLAGAPNDPRPYLREFDVFVLAARHEPLALRMLEAMALDLPVIAPDEGAPGEWLAPVQAVTGASLYPPGDAAALAMLVRRVRDEPGLRERMRDAQRTYIEDFRVERMAEAVLKLYREVTGAS